MNRPSPTPNDTVKIAVDDLADHLSVSIDTIEVVEARAVTWRTSALGCPMPGEFYNQALVDGMLVLLRHGDDVHRYHAGKDGRPFRCVSAQPEEPLSSQDEE
ncbi:MAG: hypothetical protein AAF449_21385 [Myxococcota bacterium]